ncbi:MAG: MerR family transcriptional regulator [Rhizomicrobium sp.]|jgi:DNA-binding transcriptional MerR regulator
MSAVGTSLPVGEKSPEAFRTISEVAVDLDVPQHVLRFWEQRFAQVKPVKRAGGRRYYRPEDVDLLRGIRSLLYHDGLTIKGVQKILRDRGLRFVAEVGRGDAGLLAKPPRASDTEADPDYARAAMGKLGRAVAEPDAPPEFLAEDERVRLELLLAQLLVLKGRLRATISPA